MLDGAARELRVALGRERSAAALTIMNPPNQSFATLPLANISRSGMFVLTDSSSGEMVEGAAVHFALHLDQVGEDVSGVGLVRWVQGDMGARHPAGFGLQVLEFHDQTEGRYLEFLESSLLSLKITDLMNQNALVVAPEAEVESVLRLMIENKADCVVIGDSEGGPLGTFSSADLPRIVARPAALKEGIGRHMTPGPLTLSADDEVEDAYAMMRGGRLMHIPVVDDGLVIGMLGTRDLLSYWAEYMDLQSKRLCRNYEQAMARIAHDLRTPIAVIQMTNSLLSTGEITPDEYVASGSPELLRDRCTMMMSLIDDILDHQAIKVGRVRLSLEVVDVAQLLHKIIRTFAPAAALKQIAINLTVTQELPKIMADPLRLEQVFNNLISNALKFSYEEESVEISVEIQNVQIAIMVSDHGPGIAANELSELFKEYAAISTRSTQGEKSIGLGLAIAKRLTDAHGGTIAVQSRINVGTTFTVFLPSQALQ